MHRNNQLTKTMTLTTEQRADLEWLVDYLEKGSAGKTLDSRGAEILIRIFGESCGFTCGCPGTFHEGLRDAPYATLLKVILCVDAG
jgi:hypothetical protein